MSKNIYMSYCSNNTYFYKKNDSKKYINNMIFLFILNREKELYIFLI